MSKGPGQAATQTKTRPRGFLGKYRAQTAFTAANFSTDVQYTVHLSTFSSDEPAVSKHSFICSSTISVCCSIGASSTVPVPVSNGGKPDTYSVSPCRVTAEVGAFQFSKYVESGSTRMTSLFIAIFYALAWLFSVLSSCSPSVHRHRGYFLLDNRLIAASTRSVNIECGWDFSSTATPFHASNAFCERPASSRDSASATFNVAFCTSDNPSDCSADCNSSTCRVAGT